MLVNMHEAKTHLSRLVEQVAAGQDVIIARAGRPIARLVPYVERRDRRQPGRLRGRVRMAEDFDETPEWLVDALSGKG